jgi:hypothetical protein
MTTHEQSLRRARNCYLGSIPFFVAFCLCSSGGTSEMFPLWLKHTFQVVGFVSGVFAWSLACTAYDVRRKAL